MSESNDSDAAGAFVIGLIAAVVGYKFLHSVSWEAANIFAAACCAWVIYGAWK